jgi:2-oxoglutarate dehydrogenase E1 component
VSSLSELAEGRFEPVLADAVADPAGVRRVVLCCGKLYYDLLDALDEGGHHDVALVRLEQLYPFPAAALQQTLERFGPRPELVWAQEEPRNMGAWRFVREAVLDGVLDTGGRALRYVGREASASPAPGSLKVHQAEQDALVREALEP